MDNETLKSWETYIFERLGDSDQSAILYEYAKYLINNNLPVIFDLEHLSLLLGIKSQILAAIIYDAKTFYREFTIPKRRSGHRTISAPYPSLLTIQRWIHKNILIGIQSSPYAHGFVHDKSIISNAKVHLNRAAILKIDLKDFFPSINIKRVIRVFGKLGYKHDVAFMLASLCCLNESLPQGAATSPALSNVIAKKLDKRLAGLAKSYSLSFSRYADDLTFSGEYIPQNFIDISSKLIKDEGFSVNTQKTQLLTGNGKKIITGISISSGKLSIPKATKRALRQEAHLLMKHGFFNHTQAIGQNNPLYLEQLIGKLSFWRQVEPDNQFVNMALAKIRNL